MRFAPIQTLFKMGIFDIVISVFALIALVTGWRKGLIIQVCSIAAIFGGMWLAAAFGEEVGTLCSIDVKYAKAAGFLIIFFVVLILVAVLSRVAKKLFKFVGLGVLDSVFGALLSVAKVGLVIGILCSAFNALNGDGRFVKTQTLDNTIFFRPLCRATEVFDLFDIDEVGKTLEETKKSVTNQTDV